MRRSGSRGSRRSAAEAERIEREHRENAEREENYRKWIEQRQQAVANAQVIEEKGIEEELLDNLGWRDVLIQRGWMQLVAERPSSNLPLVKEFYVHTDGLEIRRHGSTTFRDIYMVINAGRINQYYGIPLEDCPDYTFGWSDDVQRMTEQMMLLDLCGPDHTKDARNTGTEDLCYEAQVWNIFCSYSITPVGRRGLTADRVRVLYSLKNGHAINLGRLIELQLGRHLEGKLGHKSIIFPSLITGLCREIGIDVDNTGEHMLVHSVIPMKTINYIRRKRGMEPFLTARERARLEKRSRQSGSSSASSSRRSSATSAPAATPTPVETLLQELVRSQAAMLEMMRKNREEDRARQAALEARIEELQAQINAHFGD